MGDGMLMKRGILTLDFWKDTITYQKRIMPTGSLACAALNISDDVIENLTTISRKLESFGKMLALGTKIDNAMLTSSKNTAVRVLEALRTLPPFDLLDMDFYLAEMERVFSRTGIKEFKAYIEALVRAASKDELLNNYCTGQALVAYMHELEQLGRTLQTFKTSMAAFVSRLDEDHTDRSPDGMAMLFAEIFPPEMSLQEENKWTSYANVTLQYVSVQHEGMSTPRLVKRAHYASFVGMFRSDFFEGLCQGHAPKKCRICGKWFLTDNAYHTKYCGGFAPDDPMGRTCRQIGNLKGREQRELAADHPLKQIYERRLNSINKSVKRGTLDQATANRMKKIAKDRMLRAISDPEYAQTDYEREMEQEAILAEVTAECG